MDKDDKKHTKWGKWSEMTMGMVFIMLFIDFLRIIPLALIIPLAPLAIVLVPPGVLGIRMEQAIHSAITFCGYSLILIFPFLVLSLFFKWKDKEVGAWTLSL